MFLHDQNGEVWREYTVSTGREGLGSERDSNRTPVGRFRIAQKIGAGAHPDTKFRSRLSTGLWDGQPSDEDHILARILWLEGLEEDNANTFSRYIYIHGTNQEDQLGTPVSHGCIRLSRADVLDLYDLVPEGTELLISAESVHPAQKFMHGQAEAMRYDEPPSTLSPDPDGANLTQDNSGLGRTSMEYYQDSYRNDSGSQDSYGAGGGGNDHRDSYRGGGQEFQRQSSPPLITEKIVTERKQFFLDLKENNRGRVLKITEDVRGRRDTIMVPIEVLQDFYEALGRIMDYERGLE